MRNLKIKNTVVAIMVFALCFCVPAPVLAESDFQKGIRETGQRAGYSASPLSDMKPAEIIGFIIQIILAFVGIAFFLLMIYGGYLWLAARDNKDQVEKAQDIIKNSILGLIVVLAAYAITAFVGQYLL